MSKLFQVTATFYYADRRKKSPQRKAIVLATSKEEAIEKYKAAVKDTDGWYVVAHETSSDVYTYAM